MQIGAPLATVRAGTETNRKEAGMTQTTTVSFEVSEHNERAELPATLWTDFVVDGHRIFIRREPHGTALATGSLTRTKVPPPGRSSSSRRPPAASTRSEHDARPT